MDMALEAVTDPNTDHLFCVSILVLMDMALEAQSIARRTKLPGRFNPCFDGYGSGSHPYSLNRSFHCVSILVLMDMALEERFNVMVTMSKESFNPCFDGYGSGSL